MVRLAAAFAASVLICGCPPPMPVVPAPTKNIGFRGEVRKIDLTFVKAGITTREEVLSQVGWSDVGINRPSVFWGRWRSSSALDLNRWDDQRILWRGHNLLIEFDESNRVKRFQEFADKDLVTVVQGWFPALQNPKEPKRPKELVLRLAQKGLPGEMRLGLQEDAIAFEGMLVISLSDINRLTCTGTGASPSEVRLKLGYQQPGGASQELVFDMEIPEAVSFLDVLRLKRHP
jgi:hypothetical protein